MVERLQSALQKAQQWLHILGRLALDLTLIPIKVLQIQQLIDLHIQKLIDLSLRLAP